MLIYKNLLDSKISEVFELEQGQEVPFNSQFYSDWDNEYIMYTYTPIFGSKETVWIQATCTDLLGYYDEQQNVVVFDPNYIVDFTELVETDLITVVDPIETILFLDELLEVQNYEAMYNYMYIHINKLSYFSKDGCKCKIDTTSKRFGFPLIDDDFPF